MLQGGRVLFQLGERLHANLQWCKAVLSVNEFLGLFCLIESCRLIRRRTCLLPQFTFTVALIFRFPLSGIRCL